VIGLFRGLRRRRLLRRQRVDAAAFDRALARRPMLRALLPEERERLRDLVTIFLAEKRLEGMAGLELDAAMRLDIALQACLPVLSLGIDAYRGFRSVYVYPASFRGRQEWQTPDGVVHRDRGELLGEAWHQGPVVLSWQDASAEASEGINVVLHEFVHQLDMLDGEANGCPPLHADQDAAAWQRDFAAAFERFAADVEDGDDTWLDPYAAEAPEEFFAVLSEAFFEQPLVVRDELPALYGHLVAYFRQDPARRYGSAP
jgi:Mlc titration factor MtfA (ptsG expression regulator)